MSKDMITQYLMNNKGPNSRSFRLTVQGAPFWKGMKESCILIMSREDLVDILSEIQDTSIEHLVLDRVKGRCVVLFYREAELKQHISKEDIAKFLNRYGYRGSDLKKYLERLKTRVAYFYEKEQSFPHEVGAFLGYPIEDVEGFIAHNGKNYLLSGYWKVYGNLMEKKHLFRQFDQAQEEAMVEWSKGQALRQIAV